MASEFPETAYIIMDLCRRKPRRFSERGQPCPRDPRSANRRVRLLPVRITPPPCADIAVRAPWVAAQPRWVHPPFQPPPPLSALPHQKIKAFSNVFATAARLLLALLAWPAFPDITPASQTNEAVLLPENFVLTGPASSQKLILEKVSNDALTGPIEGEVHYDSSNPKVVKIEAGVAIPLSNGRASITARGANLQASTAVTVNGMETPVAWSFRNHVQPILAKYGCSAGACHGAAAGQNGFKLSLRGYDDESDYLALTRHARGRRIIPSDPGRSLLLLKPTRSVPHKGGKRFAVGSKEYRILAEWIANGSPGPKKDEPRIDHIEVQPDRVRLKPGDQQPFLVRAWYSDGHGEDVTRWTKFTDANSSVTQVDEEGNVKVMGFGEGAITAWFMSRIALTTVTVPQTNAIDPQTFAQAARRNFIDDQVLEKLRNLNLPFSERADDETFIRRAFLDTLGVLPTTAETRAFLASRKPDKRDALIESLLSRPEFVDYWSYKWSDLLLVQSKSLKPAAMWAYYNWIRNQVAANTPWDRMVYRIVTASGSNLENGSANFFLLHDDPKLVAENTSQAFLGMSIQCAKCHNHPMEKWTNDEYFGFANLFARVRMKNGPAAGEQIIFASTRGDLVQPRTGKPQPPRPLDGRAVPLDDPGDRREVLARWLVSPDNPYFSRAIVNRVWANFFGVGLVEKVDDLRTTNPASNEALLGTTAAFLASHHFDLKALMRAILRSETYQRSSRPLPENAADTRFYARYYPKRLKAEVLLDAFS